MAEPDRTRSSAGGERVRFLLRALGVFSVSFAVVLAANIAWLLWGTGIFVTSHAQQALRQQLVAEIGHPRIPSPGPSGPPGHVRYPVPREGQAVGILKIPRLRLDMVIVEGTGTDDLKKGPGHYPGTAFPWEAHGRVAIAGHRTTYLRPFWSLDRLSPGDPIRIQTEFGTFVYRVVESRVVPPGALWVARQTRAPTLVLTTCDPRFSASHRLAVFAVRT